MFVMATSLIVFSFTNSYLIAFIVFIPLGFAQAGRMALSNTLAQVYSDDEHRGRVMSIYMLNWAMTNFGVFFVGVLADVVGTQGGFSGAQIAVGGSAILLLAVTIFLHGFREAAQGTGLGRTADGAPPQHRHRYRAGGRTRPRNLQRVDALPEGVPL